MNVFDILGPVMIGPSSSHTAGAARIGLMARTLLAKEPVAAEILLHGSFAKTYKGHGTDRALVAGILGMAPDDERLRDALTIAEEQGLHVTFTPTEFADSHPNTAEIHLTAADGSQASLRGASVGGGRIEVVRVNDMPVSLTGEYFTLIVIHRDTPGAIADVTQVLTHYKGNICHFDLSRKARGGEAIMTISMDSLEHSDISALCAEIEARNNIYQCIAIMPIA
ncbi:MAG: L-serine ammonia-lyase, iron-sulfur-dependent subunit beta [Peptococcaceae bacterium]|nr:L-serine ammonia-lyase, iron-sulfur-dependent subunit beta [Peptococcaceae bacterium]